MKFKIRDHIAYEDDSMIVINKPAGLLVIPDRQNNISLKDLLAQYLKSDAFVVHRLDKATSGLVVFAKTKEAHQDLNEQFQSRKVVKKYYALVNGHPNPEDGDIKLGIRIQTNVSKSVIDEKKGKPSHTAYKIIEKYAQYSLVDITLHTGRMHQIRVHFAAIGNPLVIDPLYGVKEAIYLSELKRNYKASKGQEERPLMDSLTLHAYYLNLKTPQDQKEVTINIDKPKNFRVLLKHLSNV